MPQPDAPIQPTGAFRLGEWTVEPSLGTARRSGRTVHLRPQLANLLACLASRCGNVVRKDEAERAVWPAQSVGETALARCVAELRHLLDDNCRQPTVIETIPKRGYRLVAPVVPLAAGGLLPPEGPDAVEAASAPVAAEESCGSHHPSTPQGDADAPRSGRARLLPRFVTVLVPAAVVSASIVAVWFLRMPPATPAAAGRTVVALEGIVNHTADGRYDPTLALAVALELERSPELRLLTANELLPAARKPLPPVNAALAGTTITRICEQARSDAVVAGSLSSLGGRYVVALEAIACRGGRSLFREVTEVPTTDSVLRALAASAARLRRRLLEVGPDGLSE